MDMDNSQRERNGTGTDGNVAGSSSLEVEDMYGCEVICCSKRMERRPVKCMQVLNNAKGALVMLCLALFMEGFINAGLFNAVISTVEKRFQIQSTESGFVASAFDIFTCAALLVLAFSGDRAFKPMWMGWGTFIMGAGCVMYALPHFTAPTYTFEEENPALCGLNITANSSEKCSGSSIRNYMYLFFLANGLIGLGSTPLFTLAITYIDENVKQKNSALYGGLYYSMGAIGPAVGYLLGSAILTMYTYIGMPVDIKPDSALWVGAWWIGFLIVGIFCIVLSFFILMFPRSLPGTSRFRQNRNTEVHRNKTSAKATENEAFGKSWKDAPKVVWLLMTNIPYISLTLSSCINYSFVYGFNTFGAKYISSVFGVGTSTAAFSFGIAAIFGAAGGQFLGGYAITKFRLTVNGILKFMIGCTAVCLVATFGFLLRCKNNDFIGPTLDSATNGVTTGSCDANCTCSTDLFKPVCGGDGISYFSACFAGCRLQANETYFTDCSCVSGVSSNLSEITGSGQDLFGPGAQIEECKANDCNLLVPFLFIIFIAMFTTIMKATPNLQATIRCIPFSLRTTAVCLQRLIFTLLGTIPGRIVTGMVIDRACISWGTECGIVGACRAYDTEQVSNYMTILLVSEMVVCLVLQIVTLAIYKPPKTKASRNDDENMNRTEDITLDNMPSQCPIQPDNDARFTARTPPTGTAVEGRLNAELDVKLDNSARQDMPIDRRTEIPAILITSDT